MGDVHRLYLYRKPSMYALFCSPFGGGKQIYVRELIKSQWRKNPAIPHPKSTENCNPQRSFSGHHWVEGFLSATEMQTAREHAQRTTCQLHQTLSPIYHLDQRSLISASSQVLISRTYSTPFLRHGNREGEAVCYEAKQKPCAFPLRTHERIWVMTDTKGKGNLPE